MSLPLEGVRVVEYAQYVAGPLAGVLLADLGADVVKVEPPAGDGYRHVMPVAAGVGRYFIPLNRGKRSVVVDLKTREGLERSDRLLRSADVALHNFPRERAERFGFDWEALHAAHPGLVVGRVSSFGTSGPLAEAPAYDLVAQARAGLLTAHASRGDTVPVRAGGIPMADLTAGFLLASGVLAALVRARGTGEGELVDVSLLAAAMAVQLQDLVWLEGEDTTELRPADRTHLEARADEIAGGVAMNPYYRCFETTDGFVAVACLNLAQRRAFLGLFDLDDSTIEAPDVTPGDGATLAGKEELTATIARGFAERIHRRLDRTARSCGRAVWAGAAARDDPRRSAGTGGTARRRGRAAGRREAPAARAVRACRRRGVRAGRSPAARGRHGRGARGARVRFGVSDEHALFAETVRAAIGDWQAPREPELGSWQDDRDDALAARVADAGWSELWAGEELLGAVVAGGIELGRAAAPLSLIDEPTLGAPLCVEGRARHGRGAPAVAVPLRGGGLGLGPPSEPRGELTLDGTGTVLVEVAAVGQLEEVAAASCWRAWNAAALAYAAGLARAALELAVAHARTREQFGAPLAALPAVQSRLADAALATDALELVAWSAAVNEGGLQEAELRWAGSACCDVTSSAHQVHGAVGFALETGLHVLHRRARSAQTWAAAVCGAAR